jgi:hypothetical protein
MNFSTGRKKRPRQPFWLPRAFVLHVFVACDDAAFEVYFDAVISDDDLFDQLFHNHAVIRTFLISRFFARDPTPVSGNIPPRI